MNRLFIFVRIVLAVIFSLGGIGFSASTALAAPPSHWSFTYSDTMDDIDNICSFPIKLDFTMEFNNISFFNNAGVLTREIYHITEQDTFTANGNTLAGIPFEANFEITYDSSGNYTSSFSEGVVEKIRLPDGSLFISAGRTNWLPYPELTYLIGPDIGHTGNIDAFCAALAP